MSAINIYRHNLIGFIECPSTDSFKYFNHSRLIAIYKLLENIPSEEKNFDGKIGDILVGGGSGESPALRISYPNAFQFFSSNDKELNFENYDTLYKAFWTAREAYILGEGFLKVGWHTNIELEMWLTENVCKLLSVQIDKFSQYKIDFIPTISFTQIK